MIGFIAKHSIFNFTYNTLKRKGRFSIFVGETLHFHLYHLFVSFEDILKSNLNHNKST